MCDTILANLLSPKGNNQGKKVTVLPRHGQPIQGKIETVNRDANSVVLELRDGTTQSVAMGTSAKHGW